MPFCGGALSGARCPPAAAAWHGGYRWVNSATSFIDLTRRYQFAAASLLGIEIAGASSAPVLSLPHTCRRPSGPDPDAVLAVHHDLLRLPLRLLK